MSGDTKLRLSCPQCHADLVVDAATGQLLFHQKAVEPIAGGATLESLMEDMKAEKTRAVSCLEIRVSIQGLPVMPFPFLLVR